MVNCQKKKFSYPYPIPVPCVPVLIAPDIDCSLIEPKFGNANPYLGNNSFNSNNLIPLCTVTLFPFTFKILLYLFKLIKWSLVKHL